MQTQCLSVVSAFAVVCMLHGCGGRSKLDDSLQGMSVANAVTGGAAATRSTLGSGGFISGGARNTGGSIATGGAHSSGGTTATGGSLFSGGGTFTGGAGAAGGLKATGGALAAGGTSSVWSLAGDYDLFFESVPVAAGCSATFEETRVNVTISGAGPKVAVVAYPDFWFIGTQSQNRIADNGGLSFSMRPAPGYADSDGPVVNLEIAGGSFTGHGSAVLTDVCDGAKTTQTVAVRLLPDRTPPRVRLKPMVALGSDSAFTFSEFRPEFSEPVNLRNTVYSTLFGDLDEAAEDVYVTEWLEPVLVPFEWVPGMSGGEAVLRLRDHALFAGHSVRIGLNPVGLADASGNLAIADDHPWNLLGGLSVDPKYDFDVAPSDGLWGNVTYLSPLYGSTFCESGGCLALESSPFDINQAWATRAPFAVLGLTFSSTETTYRNVSYRLFSTDARVFMTFAFPTGCQGWSDAVKLTAMATPVGPFNNRSEWSEAKLGPCYSPARDRGLAIAIGCDGCSTAAQAIQARLVVEWIEDVP